MPGVEKWEGRNSRRTKLRVVHTSKIVLSHKPKTRGDRYCTADKKIWSEATRKKLGGEGGGYEASETEQKPTSRQQQYNIVFFFLPTFTG